MCCGGHPTKIHTIPRCTTHCVINVLPEVFEAIFVKVTGSSIEFSKVVSLPDLFRCNDCRKSNRLEELFFVIPHPSRCFDMNSFPGVCYRRSCTVDDG